MRTGRGSGVLWILVVLVCFSGGCGRPHYGTPQATFQAAKSALARNDGRAFCDCLTPEAQDETAGVLIVFRSYIRLGWGGEKPDPQRARVRAERIKAVLKKHGVSQRPAPKVFFYLTASEDDQRRELLELVEPIKDRTAFIRDFIRVVIETADRPGAKLVEPNARLLDLKIENDTATATFAQTREGQERAGPIKFKKVNGEWKISKLPRLLG